MNNSRRSFLKTGLMAGAGVFLGGLGAFANTNDEPATVNQFEIFDELHYQPINMTLQQFLSGDYKLNMTLWTAGVNPNNQDDKWTIDGRSRWIDAEFDLKRGMAPGTDVNTILFDKLQPFDADNRYDSSVDMKFTIMASEIVTNTDPYNRKIFNVIGAPDEQAGTQTTFQMRKLVAAGQVPMNIIGARTNDTPSSVIDTFKSDSYQYGLSIWLPQHRINPMNHGHHNRQDNPNKPDSLNRPNRPLNRNFENTIVQRPIIRLVNTNIDGEQNGQTIFQEKMYFTPNSRNPMPILR
jgi:hypothetical protein